MTKFVTRLFIGVLILNSLISIYGYVSGISALAAYDGRDGTKGIFASVNDTAGLYSIAYLYGIANASTVLGFAFLIAVVIGSTLLALGSRSMFGILFLLPIAYFVFRNASQKKYVNAVGLILLGLAPVAVFFANFDYISNLFFSQSLRVFDETGSVFSALLSFRDLKIQSYFLSIGNPLDVIIGLQVSPRHLWNDLIPSSYMIESDLFDLLSRVGLIGTLAIVLLIKKVTSKGKGAAAQTMMFLVIVFGSLVGHFLVSSPNACWVSFWLVQFSTNRREKN